MPRTAPHTLLQGLVLIACLVALPITAIRADYDPRDDPNSPQSRAAAQKARQVAAANKAKQDAANAAHKAKYEATMAEMYRPLMAEKAKGMTDAQVVAAYPAWQTEQNAIAQKGAADTYRRILGEKAKGLSDKEVMAMVSDPKWHKQYQQDRVQNMGSMFANMSPEQRLVLEKNAGMSAADLEKKLPSASAPKK
jgi:hypothetical protein